MEQNGDHDHAMRAEPASHEEDMGDRRPMTGFLRIMGAIWQGRRTMNDQEIDRYAEELRKEGLFEDEQKEK